MCGPKRKFDYIVIGAGSAGCVLASRLSEHADFQVLLLEAGGADTRREIHIPAAFSSLMRTEVDWSYETEPETGLGGRRMFWPRGKVLGGSSAINAMIYVRGDARIYDGWARQTGDDWAYERVLPYFKKSENQQRGGDRYHGVAGPLDVADLADPNPLSHAFIAAGCELGFEHARDFNVAEPDGVGLFQVNQRQGKRHSAYAAFLEPVAHRDNLYVCVNALVTSIGFQGRTATGVTYLEDGQLCTATAEREVILAAGAVNSPQLLMLSGIGPRNHLRQFGIPVVQPLEHVGDNLTDHLAVSVAFHCREPITLRNAGSATARAIYRESGTGPLASNVAEAGGFFSTRDESMPADLQFHFAPCWYLEHGSRRPSGHGLTLVPTLVQPRSRGRIRLGSADPRHPPRIQANYLTADGDLDVLVAGVQLARRLARTRALQRYVGDEYELGVGSSGDDAVRQFVLARAETLYHPVGTCRMGNSDHAVVDSQLRVRGVQRLRVADASVMPWIPNANINTATMMIAEKAADMILEQKA